MPETAQQTADPVTESAAESATEAQSPPETSPDTSPETPPEESPPETPPAPAPPPDAGPAPSESEAPEPADRPARGHVRSPVRRLRAALRRVPFWWPLPLCLVLGAGAGAVHSATAPPQYTAVSYVVVSPAGRGADPAAALGYAQAYGRIATDPMVVALAERNTGLKRGTIAGDIRASTSPDAPMVEITATWSSPAGAARNADAVAEALTDTATSSARRTGTRLTVVSKATAPPSPVSPSTGISTAVGACAGGLLGGLLLLVRRRPAADTSDSPATQAS